MQSMVISNLRATRLALTGLAAVRAKSDNLSAKIDDSRSAHSNRKPDIGRNVTAGPAKNTDKNPDELLRTLRTPSINPKRLSDGQRLAKLPTNKIRAMIQYDSLTPECINLILRFIAAKQVPDTLLDLVEEKALSYLALDDDDFITKFIRRTPDFDYDSICELLMGLASNHRKPIVLLKAAADQLCKLPPEKRADFTLIAGTLSALISLRYPNKPLIARLMNDLSVTLSSDKFTKLRPKPMCDLLRVMRTLRWRNDKLLEYMIDYLSDNPSKVDQKIMVTLMYTLAHLDYPVSGVLQQLHKQFVGSNKEEPIKQTPKLWLGYVWSLVALRLADKRHLESVLTDTFCRNLSDSVANPPIDYSDAMKLSNLRVLAEREYELGKIDCYMIESLGKYKILRSAENKKFHQNVENALLGIVGTKEKMLTDVTTPYGFRIDFELALDQNSSELLPIDASRMLEDSGHLNGSLHLAGILVAHEDSLINLRGESVGYKKMISRIFRSFGYQTAFLPEAILNREKTSADLTNKIKEILALPNPEAGTK